MPSPRRLSRRKTLASAGALLAMVAAMLTVPAGADVKAQAGLDCPPPVPLNTVKAGMIGEGLTVVKGSTPEPFKVEVLGVLKDGISAGRDMIIINATDYTGKHVIDQGGGIWAGMSGSPVYVGDKLLGAVSYGFTNSPSPLGGVTPAQDMVDVLGYTVKPAKAAAPRAKMQAATKIKLSATAKRDLAAKAGVSTPRGTMQQLVTPLAISGVGSKRINEFQDAADAAGLAVKAYAAGSHSAPRAGAAPAARPQAGGNFAATLSYGDVTAAGIGTTTAVCGNQALAFGHPMNRIGPSSYGANDADSVAIVKDEIFGPFKMANVGADVGTVDQDRTAAIRADLTTNPPMADVTTIIRNGDTGKKRTGTTKVIDQSFLPSALVYGIWDNYDAVFDEWGDGVASAGWTITGTRAGGAAFRVSHKNQWADREDVTVPPAFEMADVASELVNNDFEKVTIDSVTFSSTAKTKYDQLHITKMEASVNGGKYGSPKLLKVKVGDKLKVRVSVAPFRSSVVKTTTLALTVPKAAKGRSGSLAATGGVDAAEGGEDVSIECLLIGECNEDGPSSFDALLKSVTSTPRNDAVIVDLAVETSEDFSTVATTSKLKTRTVTGYKEMSIKVAK